VNVIIAGSRTIRDYQIVEECIKRSGFKVTKVISGGAEGVDRLGEEYARRNKLPIQQFLITEAEKLRFGRIVAPKMRNTQMAHVGQALIAIWDGSSGGTGDMINKMRQINRPVKVFVVGPGGIKNGG
jgi:hypothetical protein